MVMPVWMSAVALGMLLGYLLGREAGYRQGNKHGYVQALKQAMQIDRPMYQLCRVLVPSSAGKPTIDAASETNRFGDHRR